MHYQNNKLQTRFQKKEETKMKKTFKRLSAVILAFVMTFGMTVMASAATMSIYTREYNDVTKEKTYKTEPIITLDTVPGESIYTALVRATSDGDIVTDWTDSTYEGKEEHYLKTFGLTTESAKTNDGKNVKLDKDSAGNILGGTWGGNAWMWCMGNDLATISYPNVTLSDQVCPSNNFSIILSYDYSEFDWKN